MSGHEVTASHSLIVHYRLILTTVDELLGRTVSFPHEVLQLFVDFASPEALPKLSLVNSTFCYEAQRILFKNIDVTSARKLILLLRILATRPALATLVRTWIIAPPRLSPSPLRSFYVLLSRALHQTRNLLQLELLMFGPYARFLVGCPFRLTKLGIGADWDEHMSQWLTEQTDLKNLIFYGANCDPCGIREGALRNVQSLSGPPVALMHVVPGRPLDDVRLCLADPSDLQIHTLQEVARSITTSTTKVMSFSVQMRSTSAWQGAHDVLDKASIADALEPVARAIPYMTTFSFLFYRTFVSRVSFVLLNPRSRLIGSFIQHILEGIGSFIEHLPGLRRLMILSRNRHDSLRDSITRRLMLEEWHKQCKTLEVVQFPDNLYVFCERFGWMDADADDLTLEQYNVLTPIVKSYVTSQLDRW